MRAVIPATVPILPVGGLTPDSMTEWRLAGAAGFGLGSAIYRSGMTAIDVGQQATEFVEMYNRTIV